MHNKLKKKIKLCGTHNQRLVVAKEYSSY